MTYLVTARKWRPMKFEDVVGQSHATVTLQNAVATQRLAHAYIFSGPRGVGKTSTARLLAKAVNCTNPKQNNPCNECENCQEITRGRSLDVIEIDGASNRGIDDIKRLRTSVNYTPTKGKYKVYIIDEFHQITPDAFNALLKTLEEPPRHVLFIFATTAVNKVPSTILSRCQRFDFRRIAVAEIVERLKYIAQHENVTIENDALLLIAKKADGSLRDAQSIFDQVISFCGETIHSEQIVQALNVIDEELYFRVTKFIRTKNVKGGLELVEEIIRRGYDIKEFLSGLSEHFRNFLVVRATGSTHLLETPEVLKKQYQEEARYFSDEDLLRLLVIVSETESAVKWSPQPRFRLETGLLQMIKFDSSVMIEDLLNQLEQLKKKAEDQRNNSPDSAPRSITPSSEVEFPKKAGEDPKPIAREPSRSYSSSPTSAASSHTNAAEVKIFSLQDIQEKWTAFVDEIRKQRINVGTLLSNSKPLEVKDGVIQLGCIDEFHLSALKRNKEFLGECFQKVYGAKLRFETLLYKDDQQSTIQSERSRSANPLDESSTPRPVGSHRLEEHPIIKALRRELGAEPLE